MQRANLAASLKIVAALGLVVNAAQPEMISLEREDAACAVMQHALTSKALGVPGSPLLPL